MKILLNDQQIDFQLETERTIYDIIVCIERWLLKSDLLVAQIDVDGECVFPSESERLKLCRVEQVKIINVSSISTIDHAMDSLIHLNDYIELIINQISPMDEIQWSGCIRQKQFLEGMQWIEQNFQLIVATLALDSQAIFYDFESYQEIVKQYQSYLEKLQGLNQKSDKQYFDISKTDIMFILNKLISFIPKIFYRSCLKHFGLNRIPSHCLKEGMQDLIGMMQLATQSIKMIDSHNTCQTKINHRYRYIIFVVQNMYYYAGLICSCFNLIYSNLKIQTDSVQTVDDHLKSLFEETMITFSSNEKKLINQFIKEKLLCEMQQYILMFQKMIALI